MSRGVIFAPFSEAQSEAINLYQADEHTNAITCDKGHNLVPQLLGMKCLFPFCNYTQGWVPAVCLGGLPEGSLPQESMTLAELQAALVARGDTNTIAVRFTKGSCGVRLRPDTEFVYGVNLDLAIEAALATPVRGVTVDTGRMSYKDVKPNSPRGLAPNNEGKDE